MIGDAPRLFEPACTGAEAGFDFDDIICRRRCKGKAQRVQYRFLRRGIIVCFFRLCFRLTLDDLAAQYPSVQLKSVQIDHAAYTNASGATTNTATYTVQLNVILCDKESVVS